jgi:hypothetical protein
MSPNRLGAATLAVIAALAAVSTAFASGGSGPGGGGTSPACAPLTMAVKLVHADGNGNTGINVQATIRNCTSAPQPLQLTVTVPNSGTVPFKFTTGGGALQPGGSLTMFASPIGSTPSALHFGQTYSVVGALSTTGATPAVLSKITTMVTMPSGPIA